MKKHFLLITLFAVLFAGAVNAQTTEEDDAPIKVDTLLLTMPVTVSDDHGRNVAGLKKENFTIYQNGSEQDIEYFFNEEAPMNVAVLIDTSASTKKVLDKIQQAAADFVKILRPEDKAVIVTFDYHTVFLSDLTSNQKKLIKAVEKTSVTDQSGSDMNDAVLQIVNKYFKNFKGRKAVIALTDGMVIKRSVTSQQAMDALRQSDTIFYPIIFRTKAYSEALARAAANKRKPMTAEILEILAQETAGRFYEKDAANLKEAFQSIAEELKNQYLLGFYPNSTDKGNLADEVRIEVDRKNFRVQTKKRWTAN